MARELLQQASRELASLAGSVRSQLFASGDSVFVSAIGGVFRSLILWEAFRAEVEREPGRRAGPPRYDPACGALIAAYRNAGLSVLPQLRTIP